MRQTTLSLNVWIVFRTYVTQNTRFRGLSSMKWTLLKTLRVRYVVFGKWMQHLAPADKSNWPSTTSCLSISYIFCDIQRCRALWLSFSPFVCIDERNRSLFNRRLVKFLRIKWVKAYWMLPTVQQLYLTTAFLCCLSSPLICHPLYSGKYHIHNIFVFSKD